MSAALPDAPRVSGKKRKHNDDVDTSTLPAKKSKSKHSASPKSVEDIPSRIFDASKAADQPVTHESSKSKRRKRKPRSGKVKAETDERHGGSTVEKNQSTKSESKTVLKKPAGGEKESKTKAERKAAKKARKKAEKEGRASIDVRDKGVKARPASSPKSVEEPDKRREKERAAAKEARRTAAREEDSSSTQLIERDQRIVKDIANDVPPFPGWMVSHPSAGRFLEHDPIFVQDEKGEHFLISATGREVQLLSLHNSLIVRTHPTPAGKSVVCFATLALNSNLVYIGYSDGSVGNWDWTNDFEPKETFTVEGDIKALASASPVGDAEAALFYMSKVGTRHSIFNQDGNLLLYTTKQQLESIQILGNGDYIISRGTSVLVLGMKKGSLKDFVWIEIPLTTTSTSLDARLIPLNTASKGAASRHSGFCLALGHSNGQIHLYDDMSSIFFLHGQIQNDHANLPTPRILHWHRDVVSTVKFSQDGNYLISGGKETVLVIWQLETGKKQFLPHLTSTIERLVVSPEGNRYALQMGDNSIAVVSTSELKAVAVFAGLQQMVVQGEGNDRKDFGFVGTLHPKHPNQMLLPVPSSQPKSSQDIAARPFLQTFDIRHARHISRQALTRNNVTDFNLGPERTPIIPPDVAHLAISADGMWLATVDEWMPPPSDLEHLDADGVNVEEERQKRREVYLKMWLWDEVQELWTLSTRVDSPHARGDHTVLGAGRVLALVADPTKNHHFLTVGEDRVVKLWAAKKSRSDEVTAVEWRSRWAVELPGGGNQNVEEDLEDERRVEGANVACSADGSLIAVALTHRSALSNEKDGAPVVRFITTPTGMIAISKPGLAKNEITALGFCQRYFIAVSHRTAYVWDIVEDLLVYKISLAFSRNKKKGKRPLLAIDHEENTFALVIDKGTVEVHHPRQRKRLYRQEFEVDVEGILSGKGRRGFVLVFANATIRTISPSGFSSQPRSLPSVEERQLALPSLPTDTNPLEADPTVDEDDDMVDLTSSNRLLKDTEHASITRGQDEEDDRPVVRPEQLANIFDVGPSFAMQPVKDMFRAVVGLFGRKPLQSGVPQT